MINQEVGRVPLEPGSSPFGTGAAQGVSAHSGDDPSRKFTFKKEPRTTGLAGVGRPFPDTEIKYGGRLCGHIRAPTFSSKDGKWGIGIMVRDDSETGWRWVFFAARFDSEPAAREWLNAKRATILSKHHLRFWDE